MVDKILRRARELVARGWTQRREARDVWGAPVRPWADDAVCWCAFGAIQAACYEQQRDEVDAIDAVGELLRVLHASPASTTGLTGWNDATGRSQAEVVRLFDAAIAAGDAS